MQHFVFVKKWIYGVTIASIWLLATSLDVMLYTVLSYLEVEKYRFVQNSTLLLCLLICLPVCYFRYFVRFHFYQSSMQPSEYPQHHGATNRETKLTTTLTWVTLASLLSWLPIIVFSSLSYFDKAISNWLSYRSNFYFTFTLLMLVGVNSLGNPIVYVLLKDTRIQGRNCQNISQGSEQYTSSQFVTSKSVRQIL